MPKLKETINIAIAEDHDIVRQGFVRMLADYYFIKILFEAGDGKELLKKLKQHKPTVLLLDIAMPHIGGMKALEIIKERYPKLKVLVLSQYGEEVSIVEYAKRGAHSFLNKNCKVTTLVEAIKRLSDGGTFFDEETTKLLLKHGVHPEGNIGPRPLTDNETAMLKLICKKMSQEDIAELTGKALSTVSTYKSHLLQKTNCKNIDDLIAYAQKNNLI